LNVLATCPRGWRSPYNKSIEVAKLAVETGFWPTFEVENGIWSLSAPSVSAERRGRKPVTEFLQMQGRFKHLFKPENAELLAEIQTDVDDYLTYINGRCGG
jgi:pyruvate ferredoxin oxidoreductase beta subunit